MTQDKQYWLRLSQRYFEAETTDEEESLLRQFAATTRDADFDELRAVMGLMAVARQEARQKPKRHVAPLRYIGMAASLLMVLGLSVFFATQQTSEPEYIAYVGGKIITDAQQVMQLMQSSMEEFSTEIDASTTVESQLRGMFELL